MKKPDFKLKMPKLDLKVPSLGGKRPSAPKTSIKVPKFAGDLYADLRDRRLLPLVALLLVALVAAPFLLAGKGDEEEVALTPGPAAGQGTTAAEAASFSVVPAAPGLRDYRKRLGHRSARNPFAQPTSKSSGDAGGGGESTVAGGSSSSSGSSGGEIEFEGSSGGSSSGGGTTTTVTQTTTDVVVESKIAGYVLDARAGFLGDVKEQPGVEPMTTLPSAKNPALVFLGPSQDKVGAIFLMTSNVTAYYGKAKCVLDEISCSTVEIRPGKSATFAYGYGKTRFKLTVEKIAPVIETDTSADSVTEKSDDKQAGEKAADGKDEGGK